MNLKNKKVLVMGLGIIGGGLDTVKWLVARGAKVTVTDLKEKYELAPSLKKLKKLPIKFILGKHQFQDFEEADLIIKNPAVKENSPYLKRARAKEIPIEGDTSLFFRLWPGKIIGITGTKGKSTTATLIYQILKAAGLKVCLAGNIGQSPLKFIRNSVIRRKNCTAVLELSSFQLENLKISPHIAVITNIFPDHLNRYKNLASYIKAKEQIFTFQKPGDHLVLNYDNKILRNLAKKTKSNIIWFSILANKYKFKHEYPRIKQKVFVEKENIISLENGKKQKICRIKNFKLKGMHNLENVLAAAAVAKLAKIKPKIIARVLKNFSGIPNRSELVAETNGVKFINDTTATIPEATIEALKTLNPKPYTLNKKIILICGGSDKKLEFRDLAKNIKKYCKRVVLLAGSATKKLKPLLYKNCRGETATIIEAGSMKEAVEKAKELAKRGDIVLLSPGAASFGLFKNEFDRGRQFKFQI